MCFKESVRGSTAKQMESQRIPAPVASVSGLTSRQPQDIEALVDAPLVVNEGESFEIKLHALNTRGTQVMLVNVDISSAYLQGITIEGSDPPFSASEEIPVFGQSFSYDLPIEPGQEIEIVLQARGEVPGNYHE